jgi:hypothetical protein
MRAELSKHKDPTHLHTTQRLKTRGLFSSILPLTNHVHLTHGGYYRPIIIIIVYYKKYFYYDTFSSIQRRFLMLVC